MYELRLVPGTLRLERLTTDTSTLRAARSHCGDHLVERDGSLTHLLARSDGDAHAAVAAWIVGPVPYEHTGGLPSHDKFGVLSADFNEDKVRFAEPATNFGSIQRLFKLRSCGQDFADVPIQICRVVEGGRQAGQRQGVHAIRREHATDPAHVFHGASEYAYAQTRKAVGFGEGACHDEVRQSANQVDDRFAVKVKVGFVYQNQCLWRPSCKLEDLL